MRVLAILCGGLGLLMILVPVVVWIGTMSNSAGDRAYHDSYYVVANVPLLVGYVGLTVGLLVASLWMWRRA